MAASHHLNTRINERDAAHLLGCAGGRTVRFAARKGFSKRGLAWLAPFQARWADWAFVLGFVVADSDDYSTKFGFKLVVLEIGCSPKLVHSNDGVDVRASIWAQYHCYYLFKKAITS